MIKIENLVVHYKTLGKGSPLLLLHGWGHTMSFLEPLGKLLAEQFQVYLLDLPGFGLSSAPSTIYGRDEYARTIGKFMQCLNIVNPVIIGHSFGGKITTYLASKNMAKKIVLIGSAGIKLPRSFSVILKIYLFKLLKFLTTLPAINTLYANKLKIYGRKLGSMDYRKASGIMRQILVKVVAEDVQELLPRIQVPTLLIWGNLDKETPLAMGKIMQQNIAGAQLKIVAHGDHGLIMNKNCLQEAKKYIDDFLK